MRAFVLAVAVLVVPASVLRADDALTVETLAPGVFAFRPTDAAFEAWRAISNSGAVVLDDGVLLYDSHLSPALVEEVRAKLKPLTDKPIRYVVNSHFHGDHVGGNWAYGPEIELITQAWTRARLLRYYAELPERLEKRIAESTRELAGLADGPEKIRKTGLLDLDRALLARVKDAKRTPLPTMTFDSKLALYRGREVQVFFLGRGHTAGDAVLFLPDAKLAFLGDLLFTKTLPNLGDGYSADWIETLEKVLQLGATRYVPGHGPISGAEDVRAMIGYLQWLRATVQPLVKQGKTLAEAQAGVALPEAYKSYRFAEFFAGNVEKVYTEAKEGR